MQVPRPAGEVGANDVLHRAIPRLIGQRLQCLAAASDRLPPLGLLGRAVAGGGKQRNPVPFGAFTGPVQVLRMDVNGDGLLDVIAQATINGKKRTRTFLT